MRPKQAIDSPIQSTLADMMEWAIAEILGKQVEVVGNTSLAYIDEDAPRHCERSEAIHLSTRWSADEFPKSVVWRALQGPAAGADEAWPNRRAGGSGTVDCFASLAMTGRAQWVSSIVVGRRLNRHSPDGRRLRSEDDPKGAPHWKSGELGPPRCEGSTKDVGNNHDDQTTEQGASRDSRIAVGLACLDSAEPRWRSWSRSVSR
jgi:hypothetical protein